VEIKNLEKQNNVKVTNNVTHILMEYATFENVHDGGDITRAFKRIWQNIQISAKV